MEPIRESLPARRDHETFEFDFSRGAHDPGTRYTVGVGRYPDGRIGEVFLDCHKLGSALTDDSRDAAMAVSIALQHGVPIAALTNGLAHYDDGRPCGLIGRLMDSIAEHERTAVPSIQTEAMPA